MRISYVVPVHNEEACIAATAEAVVERLHTHPGSELIMVENGSTDASPALVAELGTKLAGPVVDVRSMDSPKGLGHALRRGLQVATGDLIVLTAADLPFGFSDLEAALELDPRQPLVIGSKAHPSSRVAGGWARRLMSWGFRLLRRSLLGLTVRDSQGSLLMDGALARRLEPLLTSGDWLISTELVAVAAQLGVEAVEVPVQYTTLRADSKVRPWRDSLAMTRGLVRLRRRLRERPP